MRTEGERRRRKGGREEADGGESKKRKTKKTETDFLSVIFFPSSVIVKLLYLPTFSFHFTEYLTCTLSNSYFLFLMFLNQRLDHLSIR